MEQIRVGIIGSGGMAGGHIKRLAGMPQVSVTALADPSEECIRRTRERQPGAAQSEAFDDYRKLLEAGITDAVLIASPHTCHFDQIINSLDSGQHVLCEKPMVCSIERAGKVIKKVEDTKKVFVLSYQRHYTGSFRYIRRMIADGHLGDVQFISAIQCQDWYRGTTGSWRQIHQLSGGGQLNDSGSHLIDIIMWTSGLTVDSVAAYADNFDTEVDINSALSMRFTNGAQGNISVVGNCPGWWEDLTYVGTRGAIYSRNGKITHVNAETGDVAEMVGLRDAGDPDLNFIRTIRGEEETQSSAIGGLRVIELTEAAWRSAAQHGAPVQVPKSDV